MADYYTEDVLKRRWNMFYRHLNAIERLLKDHPNIKFRMPNMPEDISENIIKFIIKNKLRDSTTHWNTNSGDLYSNVEGKQECKCFRSDGPISFGPTESWDVLYFLDARNTRNLALWRVNLTNTSRDWLDINLTKTTKNTYEKYCGQGKRPRITWKELYPQISEHATLVYEGPFHGIFSNKA